MAIVKIGVVGAGTMGAGIAQLVAMHVPIVLADVNRDAAEAGRTKIAGRLARAVERGKLDAAARDQAVERIAVADGLPAMREVDYVIEAAPEKPALKLEIFRRLGEVCPESTILASNTSSIPITKLAAATNRPDRVIGLHFMNPPTTMKLIEIIRGLDTSETTYRTTVELAQSWGKTTVTCKDSPGFVVNRILIPLVNEACFALQEGLASAEDIDKGVQLGIGLQMGPLSIADLIGLDTTLAIAETLHRELGEDKYRPAAILRSYVDAGRLGRKTTKGFFNYG